MLIEIDLSTCKYLQVTPNQLIFVKLLIEGNQKNIKEFIEVSAMGPQDIDSLIEKGIIDESSRSEDLKKLKITQSFLESLETKNFFDEFYEAYPKMTVRSDGVKDYLRTDMNRCRKYYDQLIGKSRSRHDNIMKCLAFEVSFRKRNNNMAYMKRMPKWLTSEEWKVYEQMMADINVVTNSKEVLYGATVE